MSKALSIYVSVGFISAFELPKCISYGWVHPQETWRSKLRRVVQMTSLWMTLSVNISTNSYYSAVLFKVYYSYLIELVKSSKGTAKEAFLKSQSDLLRVPRARRMYTMEFCRAPSHRNISKRMEGSWFLEHLET
jgi:hypothetical protein